MAPGGLRGPHSGPASEPAVQADGRGGWPSGSGRNSAQSAGRGWPSHTLQGLQIKKYFYKYRRKIALAQPHFVLIFTFFFANGPATRPAVFLIAFQLPRGGGGKRAESLQLRARGVPPGRKPEMEWHVAEQRQHRISRQCFVRPFRSSMPLKNAGTGCFGNVSCVFPGAFLVQGRSERRRLSAARDVS